MATIAEQKAELQRVKAARAKIKKIRQGLNPDGNVPDRAGVLGGAGTGPYVRKGEDIMGSRGYSFARLCGYVGKRLTAGEAKIELETARQLNKAMQGTAFVPANGTIMAPFAPELLEGRDGKSGFLSKSEANTLKSMMWASGWTQQNADPEMVSWLTQKGYLPDTLKVGGTAQSWIQQNLGGAVVPFPEMGPLIPLLRNKNAVMSAGATVMPMPPSGRLAFPRQTGPATVYHVGEGTAGTVSNVTTDQLLLSAKKIMGLVTINNELIRFGGPVVEQMVRNDLTISLGLQFDYDMLQAEGSDNVTAGLIGYPGVTAYTAGTVGGNGNTLVPGDIYQMIGQIVANNANFEGWIIRPELLYTIAAKRASVLASGDNLGLFLFDLTRELTDGKQTFRLGGHPVVATANAPANRVKGSGTNLTTVYGGMWSDYIVALYGTIEFAQATEGDTTFAQDQTRVRAILSGDSGPRHAGAFIYSDQLLPTTIGQ